MTTTSTATVPQSARPSDSDARFHAMVMWSVAGLMILVLWVRPLASSFWLDEFGTWWVVKDGIRETFHRSAEIQGQSPLYYLIEWSMRHVVGQSELGLRIPSLLFAGATAFLMYRLGKRLVDAEVGRIAVVGFVVWPAVAFSAADARPYALATLAVVASTAALIRWLDRTRWTGGAAYVLLAALVVYVHYVFGLVLVAHLFYARARMRERSTTVRSRDVVWAGAGLLILVLPLAYQVAALWQRREEWSVRAGPSVVWIASVVVPAAFVLAALFGGIAIVAQGSVSIRARRIARSDLILLVAWILAPIAIFVAVSIFSSASLVQTRYALAAAPAAILLLAVALRSIEPVTARRIIILALAVFSVLELGRPEHKNDWRGAARLTASIADDQTVVLVQPGFTESDQLNWYSDPDRRSFLLSPMAFYPIPGRLVPLPWDMDSASSQDFVKQSVKGDLGGADRLVFVNAGSDVTGPWLREFLGPGWTERDFPTSDSPSVTEYTRSG